MSGRGWRSDRRVTRLLDDAAVLHVAVAATGGPHVTPVAFDVDGGRVLFVVPRRSVKARAVRRCRRVGALVHGGDRAVLLGGRARIVDPLTARGVSSLGRLVDLPFAAGGYLSRNYRHVLGIVEDHPTPTLALAKVAISLDITRVALFDGAELVGAWGRWPEPGPSADRPGRSGEHDVDLHAGPGPADLRAAPARIRELLHDAAPVMLGWPSPLGPMVLPGRWRPDGVVEVPGASLDLSSAGARPVPACVTVQRSGHRLDDKEGLLLTGHAQVIRRGSTAEVALRPRRLIWWSGDERHRVELDPR